MDETTEQWVLEYSRIARMNGSYPLHIDMISHAGRPPKHWRVIFVGTHEQVWAKCEEMHRKLCLKDIDPGTD